MINYADYPIVIMSCDGYRDVWPPMVASFERFWPDCPFPIYLCSEMEEFEHSKIGAIKVGRSMGWSEMLIEVAGRLTSPNIIYLQEDYILKGPIKTSAIEELLSFYEKNKAAYLRLIPFPPPDRLIEGAPNVGVIEKGSQYRTSLQAAVWDRAILLSILDPRENGWEFEKNSVSRSDLIDRPFFSVGVNASDPNKNHHRYPLDYYSTAILQGKWQKEGVKILRKAGIPINTKKRGYLTRWDFYYYHQQKRQSGLWQDFLKVLDKFLFNRKKHFRKF